MCESLFAGQMKLLQSIKNQQGEGCQPSWGCVTPTHVTWGHQAASPHQVSVGPWAWDLGLGSFSTSLTTGLQCHLRQFRLCLPGPLRPPPPLAPTLGPLQQGDGPSVPLNLPCLGTAGDSNAENLTYFTCHQTQIQRGYPNQIDGPASLHPQEHTGDLVRWTREVAPPPSCLCPQLLAHPLVQGEGSRAHLTPSDRARGSGPGQEVTKSWLPTQRRGQ